MASDGAAKIYTKGGDQGKTSLIGGTRVSKSHLRLDCYGTLDELNSVIGLLECEIKTDLKTETALLPSLLAILAQIQNDLFNIGSQLACEDAQLRSTLPTITAERSSALEQAMDSYSSNLKPLKNFILPGGSRAASVAHLARTICRRAERVLVLLFEQGNEFDPSVIQYVNRLSDYFFVLARFLNHHLGIEEPIWGRKN